VRNLAIRNFPNHAIEAWQTAEDFNACRSAQQYADGLYVTRTVLSGNTRGIVAKGIDVSLRENVIHDQRRAGIFIDGSYYSYVKNNIIVGSGASGIFINPSPGSRWGGIPGGGEIIENIIHSNVEWGVARTANGLVQVSYNSIYDNGLYGIDVGLDLATPNRTEPGPGVPNKPTLISATYDPVSNKTVIRGIAPGGGKVDLYASRSLSRRGYPEAEKWLTQDWATGTFAMSVDGDLRGQWITATNSVFTTLYFLRAEAAPATNVYRGSTGVNTSELSDAVQVQ
jgi:hypothetical protein